MIVEVVHKHLHILVNLIKKQGVQQPQMLWNVGLEEVELLKPFEECLPAPCKLNPHLDPHTLDPGVVG